MNFDFKAEIIFSSQCYFIKYRIDLSYSIVEKNAEQDHKLTQKVISNHFSDQFFFACQMFNSKKPKETPQRKYV